MVEIVSAIILLSFGMVAVLSGMNYWESLLFGGDIINMVGKITISLISFLTK
jgi:hypothetical protein